MKRNWLLVETINYPEKVFGWIHNSVVSSKFESYSSQLLIYDKPEDNSEIIDKVKLIQYIKILESKGLYSKIRYKNDEGEYKSGYAVNDDLCGNPYTTCN